MPGRGRVSLPARRPQLRREMGWKEDTEARSEDEENEGYEKGNGDGEDE